LRVSRQGTLGQTVRISGEIREDSLSGNYELPHVLDAEIRKSRIEIERTVPYRDVAYRSDQTTKGRTVTVSGEIRVTTISEAAFWIELLRRLADDTARLLDLEDDETPTFNAKLVSPQYTLAAEN
jgi:hypothetical protein